MFAHHPLFKATLYYKSLNESVLGQFFLINNLCVYMIDINRLMVKKIYILLATTDIYRIMGPYHCRHFDL